MDDDSTIERINKIDIKKIKRSLLEKRVAKNETSINILDERMDNFECYNESNIDLMGAQMDCMCEMDKKVNKNTESIKKLQNSEITMVEELDKQIDPKTIETKAKNYLDYNKDGKIDWNDIKSILISWSILFVTILAVTINYNKDKILDMIILGIPDYEFITNTIVLGTVSGVLTVIRTNYNKQSVTDKQKISELITENSELKRNIAQNDLDHQLEIKKVEYDRDMELQKKELEIVEFRTITNIEKCSKDKIVREEV